MRAVDYCAVRRGAILAKATTALITLVLVLAAGAAGGDRAGVAQEDPPGGVPSGAQAGLDLRLPEIEAGAWALVDVESGLYLAGDNPDEPLPAASTANVMTALVALEEGTDPEEEATVSQEAESYVGTVYSNVGLIAGERVTVEDLLVGALVPSGTDAVYALAEHVGDGSVENFVGKMNARASEMGLTNTGFETPAGLDADGDYSSARDLAALSREALGRPPFAELVGTTDGTIVARNAAGNREIDVFNTNQLLTAYPKATGVKTGTTPQGGANLVASAEDGDESYVAVVLGAADSEGRYRAARTILEHGFDRYEHRSLVGRGEAYGELTLPYRRGESVGLVATEDVTGLAESGSEPERRVETEEPPPNEAEAGRELGRVEVFVGGQSVGRSPLVVEEGYREATLWDKAWYAVEGPAERAWGWLRG